MVASLLLVPLLVAPRAEAAPDGRQISINSTADQLTCGEPGGFVGSAELSAPHPQPGAANAGISCTSKRSASAAGRGGSMAADLAARGTTSSSEGTYSTASAIVFGRHRIARPVDAVTYQATVVVDSAEARVAVGSSLNTTAAVVLGLTAIHSGCPRCTATTTEFVADTITTSDAGDTSKGETFELTVSVRNAEGGDVPRGNVNVFVIGLPMVLTGTYAAPAVPDGSATVRARATRLVVLGD